MSNVVKCQDCETTMTRGNAHVRSVSLEQVFFCPACWLFRQQVAELVRSVHDVDAPAGGTLGERMERARAAARLTAHMRG